MTDDRFESSVELHDDELSDESLDRLTADGRLVGTVGSGGGKTVGTVGTASA